MSGQDGGMVDDGLMDGMVNDFNGDELGAEGKDIQLGIHALVLFQHLRQRLTLLTPPRELEHTDAIFFCSLCCNHDNKDNHLQVNF